MHNFYGRCEECQKCKRVWKDKHGMICTECQAEIDMDHNKWVTGYEFTYKFLLMELENEMGVK